MTKADREITEAVKRIYRIYRSDLSAFFRDVQASDNTNRERSGRRLFTVEAVSEVCSRKGSVTCQVWKKPCSAAFLMSMRANVLLQFIKRGIYEYRKPW